MRLRVTVLLAGLLAAPALMGCTGPETPADAAQNTRANGPAADGHTPQTRTGSAATPKSGRQAAGRARGGYRLPVPRIVHAGAPLECVPFARRHVNISLRGAAWTWWRAAKGRYERGRAPRTGSVLVLKRRGNSLGHIAVVTRIVGPREIIVDHANWLNRGRIHLATPVRDVSKNNDWSAVRVWYTPGKSWGRSIRPAYGFIYPRVGAS